MKFNLKTILTIHTPILLLLGIMDLFMAETAVASLSSTTDASSTLILMVRMMGGTFLSLAALTWLLREAHLSHGRRAGLFMLAIGNVIATVLQAMAIMDGTLLSTNWIGVAISGLFGAAYLYYAWKEHQAMTEKMVTDKVSA